MSQIVDCSEFCRLCLVKEQVNTPIFEEDGGYHQLSTKISTCLPVKVSREDSLPKRICDGCCYKVEQQYQFWNISLNAEKQFKQWLGISEDTETAKQNVNKIKKESTYDGPSASKRPKRNARRKAVQNIRQATAAQQSDSDSDIPLAARTVAPSIEVEPIAKDENDSDHHDFPEDNDSMDPPNFVNMNLEGEQDQAGPSGLQKAESTEPVEAAPATLNMEIEAGEGSKNINMYEEQSKIKILEKYINSYHEETMNHLDNEKNDTCYVLIDDTQEHLCEICNLTFTDRNLFNEHSVMHENSFNMQCMFCQKSFKRKKALKNHIESNHLKDNGLYGCETCGITLRNKIHFDNHIKKHNSGQFIKCEFCKQYCSSIEKYILHKRMDHHRINFICGICERKCRDQIDLDNHCQTHKESYKEQRPFQCSYCEHRFVSNKSLRAHEKSHNPNNRFVCPECGKSVSTKHTLVEHIRLHTGERPCVCHICGQNFTKKSTLRTHVQSHFGQKLHQCPVCKKSFTQRSTLIVHMRYHSDDRPHNCVHCQRGYVSRSLRNTHQATCIFQRNMLEILDSNKKDNNKSEI